MTNSEKAAYIRGLMEGMDLDPNAKETKLFNAIVDCSMTSPFPLRKWKTHTMSSAVR